MIHPLEDPQIQSAFECWVKLSPPWDKACCSRPHEKTREEYLETRAGEKFFIGMITDPLPDHLVCPREKAWRHYIRLRDLFLNDSHAK